MSEQAGAASPQAPQASPAESGRPAEPVTATSDGKGQTFTQEQVDSILAKRLSERDAKAKAEIEKRDAELAVFREERERASLDGMKPEEIKAKYDDISTKYAEQGKELAAYRAKEAEGVRKKVAHLPEATRNYIEGRLEVGDMEGIAAFLAGLPEGATTAPKPSDPATPPNNPTAALGVTESEVKEWRKAAETGDIAKINELKDKHGLDKLREADQALHSQGK